MTHSAVVSIVYSPNTTMYPAIQVLPKPQEAPAWEVVPGSLAGSLAATSQGLYVFLFRNPTDQKVLDNNKRKKVVVQPSGVSMKPGKFEKTLLARLANYNVHLHRVLPEQPFQAAFWECFVEGHVLDLSAANAFPAARLFEPYWVEATRHFLRSNDLLEGKQLGRSEWRYLRAGSWTAETRAKFSRYLAETANRIHSMLKLSEFPPSG